VNECGPIAALSHRAHELDGLDRQLRQSLPSPLREQVRLADARDGRLVFLAPTSAWASRLRLAQTQLLSAARTLGTRAESVIVKVAPLPPIPEEPAIRKPLSPATADHLRSTAASLSDPEMRALFLSLASIADGSPSPHGSR
jgi:hypothetical protein